MDCPTITVHTGKCHKALINSGLAISLIRYSTCQFIDGSFKTPIKLTSTKLNTADGLPMTALGMTGLHCRIAHFKFTHIFIICDRLPYTEIMFGINYRRNLDYHMFGTRKRTTTYKRMADFSHTPETVNRR